MSNDTLSQILVLVLGVMIFILMILLITFLILKVKISKKEKVPVKKEENNKEKNKSNTKTSITYNKQSIMDFMEFEGVEDNMIIQKNGRRYLMVVECQGVNYDLMSRVEKVSVEEGFQQFLNTLRHPIQIYIQTRTVNLENSISTYKGKIKDIEDQYNKMLYTYNQMKKSEAYSSEEIDKYYFELTKQRNLLEYGRDIVSNTEKISLNKNVLSKKYYVIIPYFSEETADGEYSVEEIRSMAFSELYTKAQSIIRTLSACSVVGKILNSRDLVELLYTAYNRDESEVFGIDKAIASGYDELYSVSEDVFEKKIKALDAEIKDKAIDLANETIEKVKSPAQQQAQDKEKNFEELVRRMAEIIISDNKPYVGEDVAESAIEEIRKTEEGGKANEKTEKTTRRNKRVK